MTKKPRVDAKDKFKKKRKKLKKEKNWKKEKRIEYWTIPCPLVSSIKPHVRRNGIKIIESPR